MWRRVWACNLFQAERQTDHGAAPASDGGRCELLQRSELCWLQLESLRSPNFGSKGDWELEKVEYPLSAKFLYTRVRWKPKSQEGSGDQTNLSQAGVSGYAPWRLRFLATSEVIQ